MNQKNMVVMDLQSIKTLAENSRYNSSLESQFIDWVKNEKIAISQWLMAYKGNFSFLIDIKGNPKKLSNNKVLMAVGRCYIQDLVKKTTQSQSQPQPQPFVINQTIRLDDWFSKIKCEELKIPYNTMWDVKFVEQETAKAFKVSMIPTPAKNQGLHGKCRSCQKALTDAKSVIVGMGKNCAEKWGVNYPKSVDSKDILVFHLDLQKKIDQIGTISTWIPKSRIILGSLNYQQDEILVEIPIREKHKWLF